MDNLPSESNPPQILKQAAGFTTTMWVALSSPTWNDLDLGDYAERYLICLLYTSPSPRDRSLSRMPSSA